jgi:hypothetical protein
LVILEFNNDSLNRKSKMQNWQKGEKKKRPLDHTILYSMWRKTKVCQERRAESWRRISCRYQVRRIPICNIRVCHGCLEIQIFWARYSLVIRGRTDPYEKISLSMTREIRIDYRIQLPPSLDNDNGDSDKSTTGPLAPQQRQW